MQGYLAEKLNRYGRVAALQTLSCRRFGKRLGRMVPASWSAYDGFTTGSSWLDSTWDEDMNIGCSVLAVALEAKEDASSTLPLPVDLLTFPAATSTVDP